MQRKSLDLKELRLTSCEYSKDGWVAYNAALLISELHLRASREATWLHSAALCMISHSEAVLVHDLAKLGRAHAQIVASARSSTDKKFEWQAPRHTDHKRFGTCCSARRLASFVLRFFSIVFCQAAAWHASP